MKKKTLLYFAVSKVTKTEELTMKKTRRVLMCAVVCMLLSAAVKVNAQDGSAPQQCGVGVGVKIEEYWSLYGEHHLKLKVTKPKGKAVTVKGEILYNGEFHMRYEEMVPADMTEYLFDVMLDGGKQSVDFDKAARKNFVLTSKSYEYCN